MNKAVYESPRFKGSYYTIAEDEAGNHLCYPVYLPMHWFEKSPKRKDRRGVEYILANLRQRVSKTKAKPYFVLADSLYDMTPEEASEGIKKDSFKGVPVKPEDVMKKKDDEISDDDLPF